MKSAGSGKVQGRFREGSGKVGGEVGEVGEVGREAGCAAVEAAQAGRRRRGRAEVARGEGPGRQGGELKAEVRL